MFWTEYGNRTQIGRANMNGKSKTYIATTSLRIPYGITIDFTCNDCVIQNKPPCPNM